MYRVNIMSMTIRRILPLVVVKIESLSPRVLIEGENNSKQ